jgi:hypothetical protein
MTVRRLWDRCYLCGESKPGRGDAGVLICAPCLLQVAMKYDASQRLVGAQLNRNHEDQAKHLEIMAEER